MKTLKIVLIILILLFVTIAVSIFGLYISIRNQMDKYIQSELGEDYNKYWRVTKFVLLDTDKSFNEYNTVEVIIESNDDEFYITDILISNNLKVHYVDVLDKYYIGDNT